MSNANNGQTYFSGNTFCANREVVIDTVAASLVPDRAKATWKMVLAKVDGDFVKSRRGRTVIFTPVYIWEATRHESVEAMAKVYGTVAA